MTQAFSKVLVRQRPLLALAVITALFLAAAAAIAPSRAAGGDDVTWSVSIGVKDADGDGIIEAGDSPNLTVTLTASIAPEAADQASGKKVDVAPTGAITLSSLAFGDSMDTNTTDATRLQIASGSGIRFLPDDANPNNQLVRIDTDELGDDTRPCDSSSGVDSSGSTPATATCTIDTGVQVVIPAGTPDGSYRISGNVEFSGTATVTFTDADETDNDDSDVIGDASGNVLPTAVSYNLVLGPVAAVDSVSFGPANTCTAAGVYTGTGNARACRTTIGINAESEFELTVLNSAKRGVLSAQLATVVVTLLRTGDAGGSATLSSCGGTQASGSSCNPTLGSPSALNSETTGSFKVRVKAPRTPGAATLRVLVVPKSGDSVERTQSLTFVGAASKYTIAEQTASVLNRLAGDEQDANDIKDTARNVLHLGISATDSRDQTVPVPPGLIYEVMGPDGKKVADTIISAAAANKADGPDAGTDPDPDTSKVRIEVLDNATPFPATGEYTLNVKSGSKVLATTTFTLAGPTAEDGLKVVADLSEADAVGTQVPITITAQDADGNNVADGTRVLITVSDIDTGSGNVLVLSGANAAGAVYKTTKNGRATAEAIVVGSARAVLTVDIVGTDGGDAGTDDDDNTDLSQANAHEVLDLSGVAAVATQTPTTGLTRTDLGQYASWMNGETTTAAALFNQLVRRGATAIHLFNGTKWVRYATVDGQRVPGALDFTVKQGDTLFIGG